MAGLFLTMSCGKKAGRKMKSEGRKSADRKENKWRKNMEDK
jgi:hypothetical protein